MGENDEINGDVTGKDITKINTCHITISYEE